MREQIGRAAWTVLCAAVLLVLGLGIGGDRAEAQETVVACADAVLPGVEVADVCGEMDLQVSLEDELTFLDPARPLVDGNVVVRDDNGTAIVQFDVGGTITLTGLTVGLYHVEATASLHQSAAQAVLLETDPETAISIFLERTVLTASVEEAVWGTVPDSYDLELVANDDNGIPIYTWNHEVTVNRPWFAYEVGIDASSLASLPTSVDVEWPGGFDPSAGFFDITPELVGLTVEGDGSWSMNGATARLVFNFTPTTASEVDEPTAFDVGGILTFVVDGTAHRIDLPTRSAIVEPLPEIVVEPRVVAGVTANDPFVNALHLTNLAASPASVRVQASQPQASFPLSITSALASGSFSVAAGQSSVVPWDFESTVAFTSWDQTVSLTQLSTNFSDSVVTAVAPTDCTIRWASTSDGEWNEPLNWATPSGLVRAPSPGDVVCIPAEVGDVTVTTGNLTSIDIAALINEQTIVLGRDLTAGTVTNRGTMQWTRRRSELIGHVINEAEGVLTVDGGEDLDFGGDSTVENYGLIDVQSGVSFGFRIGGSNSTSSSLTNKSGGTVRLAGGTSVIGGSFVNEPGAVIETSGVGTAMLQVTLDGFQEQGGIIRTVAGTDFFMRSCGTCTRSFTNTLFDIATGSEFRTESAIGGEHQITGTLQPAPGATGTGTVHFSDTFYANGGVVYVDFAAGGQRFIFDGTNPHTVDVLGHVRIAAGSVAHLEGTGASGMNIMQGATVTNYGTFRILENGDLHGNGTFTNLGRFEVDLDPAIAADDRAEIGRGSGFTFDDIHGVIAATRGNLWFNASASFSGTTFEAAATQEIRSSDTTIMGVLSSGAGQGVVRFERDLHGAQGSALDFSTSGPALIFDGSNPHVEQSGSLTNTGALAIAGSFDVVGGGELVNQGELELRAATLGGDGTFRNDPTGVVTANEGDVRLGVDTTTLIEELGGELRALGVNVVIDDAAQATLTNTRFQVGPGMSITIESDAADTFAGTFGPSGSVGGGAVVFRTGATLTADPLVILDFPGSGTSADTATDIAMSSAGASPVLAGTWQVGAGTTLACDGGCAPDATGTLRILGHLRLARDLELPGGLLELVGTATVSNEADAVVALRVGTGTLIKTGAGAATVDGLSLDALTGAVSVARIDAGTLVLQAPASEVVTVDGTWLVRSAGAVDIRGGAALGTALVYSVEVAGAAVGHTTIQGQAVLPVGSDPTVTAAALGSGATAQRYELIVAAGGFIDGSTVTEGMLPANYALAMDLGGITGTGPSIDLVAVGPNEGETCDDGDVTTSPDVIVGGACVGTPVDCDDGISWTADIFDGSECVSNPVDGAACDDGSLATTGDVVTNGVCVGSPVNCDDGQAWTTDFFDDEVGCSYEFEVGADCDDLDPTTFGDRVGEAGACTGTSVDCDDEISWTVDSFDGAECVSVPVEGAPCDDGDAATQLDAVVNGLCVGGPSTCDDGISWTVDSFDGVECVSVPSEGAACDDGSPSTVSDTVVAGECTGSPISCDDGNDWTEDAVDPLLGCVYVFQAGTPCDDGSPATVLDEVTEAGECVGVPKTCSDNGVVVAGGACVCDSGWTGADCETQFAPSCDDGIAWTVDSFDGVECVSVPDEGAACDDGSLATENDTVTSGECSGEPVDCADGPANTVGSADPNLGCIYEVDVGGPCDDGSAETTNDAIDASGDCVGSALSCSSHGVAVLGECVCKTNISGVYSGDDCSTFTPNNPTSPPVEPTTISSAFFAPPPPDPVAVVYTAVCVSETQVKVHVEVIDTATLGNVVAVVTNGSPSTTSYLSPGTPILVAVLLSQPTQVSIDGPSVAPLCAVP